MQRNFGDEKQSKVQVSYEISKNDNILHQESPTIPQSNMLEGANVIEITFKDQRKNEVEKTDQKGSSREFK